MATRVARFGSIKQYVPGSDFEDYVERLEQFFAANDVPLVAEPTEEQIAKQRGIFLSSIGAETYTLLKDLVAPAKQKDKTYEQLKDALLSHLKPKRLVISERFRFHSRKQKEQETVTHFAAAVSHLATTCQFSGDCLQEMLRDRFVCGLRHATTQKKLLTEEKLTYEKAVQIALSFERAETDAAELQVPSGTGQPSELLPVRKVDTKAKAGDREALRSVVCFRCGRRGHEPARCKFLHATCFECRGTGHIAPVCRAGGKKHRSNEKCGKPQKAYQVEETSDEETNCFQIQSVRIRDTQSPGEQVQAVTGGKKPARGPMLVQVKIQGQAKAMELDTGSARSLISKTEFDSLNTGVPVEKTKVRLQSFTGEQIAIAGEAHVQVEHNGQSARLQLVVVSDSSAPSLLGRDWLEVIRLDWHKIQKVSCPDVARERLQVLLEAHANLFEGDLGMMRGVQAKLQPCQGAVPKFLKARPVPYALRSAVEAELDRLERTGIVEKVKFSEWGTPLVCIPKKDGSVRLCGDYKVTVNQQIEVEQYPIPTPAELFAAVSGGRQFSRLDLANAYQQMPLEEGSRDMVTVHTHRGLYRFLRLPFGVASAPAIFQQAMEQVLAGLDQVVVYLDDILVTGNSTEEHLERLSEVFKRLEAVGLRLKKEKCEFLLDEVEYLGFKINQHGISPSSAKVEAIMSAPEPKNQTQLRAFLGLVNYHRKFVPDLATLLEPLNTLLRDDQCGHWEHLPTAAQCVMSQVKQKLAQAPCLDHFRPELPLVLAADASQYGVGAVLMHRYPDGSERAIAYASRTLSKAEEIMLNWKRRHLRLYLE